MLILEITLGVAGGIIFAKIIQHFWTERAAKKHFAQLARPQKTETPRCREDAMKRAFAAAIFALFTFTTPASAGCDTGHWIKSVSDGGEIVILEDDSVWEINPVDTVDTALWLPVTNIIICGNELINTDDGEKASARRLR